MSTLKTAVIFILGLGLGGGAATLLQRQMMGGEMMPHDMNKMNMSEMKMSEPAPASAPADAPSTAAYKVAMDKMMSGMMVPYTGDADVDFAAGMIPHHQGAIDMAKVVLEFGKDAEIRKLAEAVVAAQESEIAFMENWLKANAK